LRDAHLVAIEPLPLLLLCRLVGRVVGELLQGVQTVPVVDIAGEPGVRASPALFPEVTGDGPGDP
jgi:hypothetical protein